MTFPVYVASWALVHVVGRLYHVRAGHAPSLLKAGWAAPFCPVEFEKWGEIRSVVRKPWFPSLHSDSLVAHCVGAPARSRGSPLEWLTWAGTEGRLPTAWWVNLVRLSHKGQAISGFLTHRNYEGVSVCFKLRSLGDLAYTLTITNIVLF